MNNANSDILARAAVETLEHRQMLSAVTFDGGVLKITGLEQSRNAIQVKIANDRVMTVFNGDRSSRQLEGLRSIRIEGGDKDDYIEVDQKISVPVTIYARAGDDRVVSGGGDDHVEGGAGNDTLHGGRGNDAIQGNDGDDRVYAGDGDDSVWAGEGADKTFGDGGNDVFVNVERQDKVYGGEGRDRMTIDKDNKPPLNDEVGPSKPTDNYDDQSGDNTGGNTDNTATPTARVTSLSLIDASTNKAVTGYADMNTGDVLDLSKLPSRLSIAANIEGTASVRFDLDGTKMYHVENVYPYALGGDDYGSFRAVNLTEGTHTLWAHAIDKDSGQVVSSHGITFSVVKSATNNNGNSDTPAKQDGSSTPTTPTIPDTPTTPSTPTNNSGTGDGSDNNSTIPSTDQNQNATAPTVKISAISTTIPAGTSFHGDIITSKMGAGDFHEGQFLWDFGDPGTRYNTLKGFSASHAYDKPGQYTVKVTIINKAGKSSTGTITVNVTAAARKVIYVASNGSDSNSGTSASSPIKSFSKAASMLGDNTEILFRRGDTFTMQDKMWISNNNVLIGAYGIGDRPTLLWNGARTSTPIFQTSGSSQNVTVQDVSIDTVFNKDTNDTSTPLAFSPAGKNLTIRRVEFLNLMYGANMNQQPDGVLMQDNTSPLETGLRKYFAWVEGSRVTIVGNYAANSTREHIVRVNNASRLTVMDNDFTNTSRRDEGDYWDYRKTALNAQSGEFAYLADNRLDGELHIGPLGKTEGTKHYEQRWKYGILENNQVINSYIEVQHGAEHVTVRHNTVKADGWAAIRVDGYNSEWGRGVVDLVMHNNTVTNNATAGKFLLVGGDVNGFRLFDNLYIAPNLTVGSYETAVVGTATMSAFTYVDGNVWPVAKTTLSWVGAGAINDVGGTMVDASKWNAYSNVGTDIFTNAKLTGTYATVNGQKVGALLAA